MALTCAEGSESISTCQTETTAELIGWGRGRQPSCQTRSHTGMGQRLGPRPMLLFMALFMTLPPYTRTSEGEVHSRGLGVRNCSHSALSDPCQNKASALNGPVKPLQPKVQLVAQIVEQKLEALLAAVTR